MTLTDINEHLPANLIWMNEQTFLMRHINLLNWHKTASGMTTVTTTVHL